MMALANYVDKWYWIAVCAGVLSIFRPSFLFLIAFYSISTRYTVHYISGYGIPSLDIMYIMEMAEFLSLSSCVYLRSTVNQKNIVKQKYAIVLSVDPKQLSLCISFIAIGFHLGNYFWSGYQKLHMGPHLWTWAFENQTENMMLVFLKRGTPPFGAFPSVTQLLFDNFSSMVVLSNLFVIIAQLLAVIAPLRLRWLFIACLAYDVMHIGIYIITGLLFWPWIWNNVSIMFSISGYRDEQVGWLPKFCCIATICLWGYGNSARLAWFDTADIKFTTIQAETPWHTWVDVPASYFLGHSYGASLGYDFDLGLNKGHYRTSALGASSDYVQAKTSGWCPEPSFALESFSEGARGGPGAVPSIYLSSCKKNEAPRGRIWKLQLLRSIGNSTEQSMALFRV